MIKEQKQHIRMSRVRLKCRSWLKILVLILASNILGSNKCKAQTEQQIIIITGGHDFEREAFFTMFEEMPGIDFQEVMHPEANQIYDSILMEKTDVLLFYDMVQEINGPQKAAFLNLLEKGKGMVFLHHSLASYQEWEEFGSIIGGRYILADQDGSTYRHDVDVPVHVMSKGHPVTRGINDFVIRDEVYGNFRVVPAVAPLLSTTHPESGKIIAWANTFDNSRIVYIQLGHDHHAYENKDFRRLLKQAIDWVQAKP